ncbi:hypothetical protein Syun_023224 [Stephania yunnanensis]|uniref:Uncharacterized protein n=1 Tax=Stephania yunnanensis TaxID=152371 RepID=A0AAP0FM48_9MAGN
MVYSPLHTFFIVKIYSLPPQTPPISCIIYALKSHHDHEKKGEIIEGIPPYPSIKGL